MRAVQVVWRDSKRFVYQMAPDEKLSVTTIISVGFLVERNKDFVAICQDDIEGDLRGVSTIPRENIISIKFLK